MVKQGYPLGEFTFRTKKACKEYVSYLINGLGCGACIEPNHPHWDIFNALINNHPEKDQKIGVGIAYFWIQKNAVGGGGLTTMIKRTDGSFADFSWRYCCEFKQRPIIEHITKAMRYSVIDHIKKFKQEFGCKFKCSSCNVEGTSSQDFHVDHIYPFCRIKDEFLSQVKKEIIPTRVALTDCGATRFHEDDYEFEQLWIDFHNSKAQLQILCAGCNLSKSDKLAIELN